MRAVDGGNTCIGADALETSKAMEASAAPRGQKARWAIVALTRPGRSDITMRNTALAEKLRPYASEHNITVVFFSEKTFPSGAMDGWRDTFKGIANVKLIDTYSRGYDLPERFGYKYMCKFFSLDMYDFLKDDYDFYMRCDTDCYIRKMAFDVFRWAEENNLGYGYATRKLEAHGPTKQTLPTWTQKYITRCGLEPTAVMDKPLSTCFNFYNNFHIGRVSFFNRPDVRHYLEAVNASGHILSHRWGDSTIQAYAVRTFMNPKQILVVPDFIYIHGSHANKVVSTLNSGQDTDVPQKLPHWRYGDTTSSSSTA